jgi:predicted homoserine dehydrogenase-like protein
MRTTTRQRIESELVQIENQIKAIESEGNYLLQAWICEVKPSGKKQAYARIQSRLPQFGGKKTRHIRKGESVADWLDACDRGQRIGKLRKQQEKLKAHLAN